MQTEQCGPDPSSLQEFQSYPINVLLIDDQIIIAEAVRRMLETEGDIQFFYCNDASQAIAMALEVKPTVILQDLVMPSIDGLLLVRYFRANPATKDIPLIVLSIKEEPKVKAEAFAVGANDYLVKLPDKIELIARIRYHSSAYIRLLERNEAYEKLDESQRQLNADLSEAAEYVKSILPKPLNNTLKSEWMYIPSAKLGGDVFGYHWLDSEHFAIYLLDVCGHGVGAALLSISVMNVLRSQSLPNTNFLNPSHVLKTLNETFPMDKHNNMFFTIWYGVYDKTKREIAYSSGGHPPAILITGESIQTAETFELKTPGIVIGAKLEADFQTAYCTIQPFNKMFVFSDGVYEIKKADGSMLELAEFVEILKKVPEGIDEIDYVLKYTQAIGGKSSFLDDFSLVKFNF
jgi:phosphoserine phosphatase RsbU/P